MKKSLSLLFVAIIVAFSIIPAFALERKGKVTVDTVFSVKENGEWIETTAANNGDIVKADIYLTTDFLLGNHSLLMYYTKGTITPVKENGTALDDFNDIEGAFSKGFYTADSSEKITEIKNNGMMSTADSQKYGIIHIFGEEGTCIQPDGKSIAYSLYFKVIGIAEVDSCVLFLSQKTIQSSAEVVTTNLDFVTDDTLLNKKYSSFAMSTSKYCDVLDYTLSVVDKAQDENSVLYVKSKYPENFYYSKAENADNGYKGYDIKFGEKLQIPTDPEKIGYKFNGWKDWQTDSFVDLSKATMDTVKGKKYYADWTAKKYKADIIVDGVKIDEVEYTYGDTTLNLPEVPKKAGYEGKWSNYTLGAADFTISAVYTCAIKEFAIKNKPANNQPKTVDYRSYISLTAVAENIPSDCRIAWFSGNDREPFAVSAEGAKSFSFTTKPSTVKVFNKQGQLRHERTYTAKVIDKNGNVIKNELGEEFSITEKIAVNRGFFKRLAAFFKALFKKLPTVVQ